MACCQIGNHFLFMLDTFKTSESGDGYTAFGDTFFFENVGERLQEFGSLRRFAIGCLCYCGCEVFGVHDMSACQLRLIEFVSVGCWKVRILLRAGRSL